MHKRRAGASQLLDADLGPDERDPGARACAGLHKGPSIPEANNHPVRHGSVVGMHNGIIKNDEEIFASHGFKRA